MPTTQYGRTALMRLLTNAPATPHRLFRQNIVSTPACRYCSCADADVDHIANECPRFNFLRDERPDLFKERASCPPCSRSCLVATSDLPPLTLNSWGTVQKCVAELFETWMAFQRNPEAGIAVTVDSHAVDVKQQAEILAGIADLSQPQCVVAPQNRIPLQWKPPSNLSTMHHWGATKQDYSALFSFWKNWTTVPFPGKVCFSSWMQVFLAFLQMGGKLSPFCNRCPNVGAALWKFRTLSISLLQQAWDGDVDFQDLALDPGHEIFWCNKMPPSRFFSDSWGFLCNGASRKFALKL